MRSGIGPVGTESVGIAQPPFGLGFEFTADEVYFTIDGRRGRRLTPGILLTYGKSWAFVSAEDFDFSYEDDERTLVMTRKTDASCFRYDLTRVGAVRFVDD